MNLQLDHFFILVEPQAEIADLLVSLGMQEGPKNIHTGQGTSNRKFYFSNGMLEFLWIHDAEEAITGPGRKLLFYERSKDLSASPFGIILTRKDNNDLTMPFLGWQYQPLYFKPPWAFHIGGNSNHLFEPLVIYVPFVDPEVSKTKDASKVKDIAGIDQTENSFKSISTVNIFTPVKPLSPVLKKASMADRLSINHGTEHLMEISFNDKLCGRSKDFRPDIPLIVHW